jgi:ABC-2 type transport system permease protein
MAYRLGGLMWVLNGAIPMLVSMFIWNMVGSGNGQITSYFLGVILLHRLTQTWSMGEISDRIKDGTLAQTLLRPYNFMFEVFAKDLGHKANRLISVVPLVIILGLIIKPVTNISMVYVAIAIPAIILGYLVNFYFDSNMGLFTNWIGDANGLSRTLEVIEGLAAGFMVPFMLMPWSVRNILNLLPFRYIFSFPLEIILGQLELNSILFGYLVLGSWIVLLISLFKVLNNVSMKHFSANGG